MTWKLTPWGKTRFPLAGIPWRDMTDEEFAQATAQVPELEERGYFAREVEQPKPARAPRPARRKRR